LSGAKQRLYANRENRSLDFLSNFRVPREDKTKHATDRYLDVLKPLGIEATERAARIHPRAVDLETIENLWQKRRIQGLTVGLFPGAGHPSRRWSLQNFASLADFITRNDEVGIAVFLGPEEKSLGKEVGRIFPPNTQIFDDLSLVQLVAALSRLSVFVSNDTGPMHLAAAVGTPVVLLMDKRAPQTYTPLTSALRVIRNGRIDEIKVEEVYQAARELLVSERVSRLTN
jgi:ADP-heptose:LPS heptosyltransferase